MADAGGCGTAARLRRSGCSRAGGLRYVRGAPRLYTAAGEQRQLLRADLALQTAEDVAETLGAMKGVMMKLGQMATYIEGGLPPAVRRTLARLQDSVPSMRPELAATVVEEELGAPPERAFARWDQQPILAASIGQCTVWSPSTAGRWPSRCSTRASPR